MTLRSQSVRCRAVPVARRVTGVRKAMVNTAHLALTDPKAPRHVTLTEAAQRARVMIVGDVHGCCDELHDLLDEFGHAGDTVILAGDLVNKGPKSVDVVRLARERDFHGILGNHEIASLGGHAARAGGAAGRAPKYEWTDGLEAADLAYLRGLPYTISLPLHEAIVVHAGLVPGVPLEQQAREHMLAMRELRPAGAGDEPSTLAGGYSVLEKGAEGARPWAACWPGPTHVYFGHDAKRRLQRHAYATGLDTGCLYGGRLTATILELGRPSRLVSVPARRVYEQHAGSVARQGVGLGMGSPAFAAGVGGVLLLAVAAAVALAQQRRAPYA